MTDSLALILDTADTRRVAALLAWPHRRGGQAHCLARLILRPAPAAPVAVLSELADNPDWLGLSGDIAGAAAAFLTFMRPYARLDGPQLVWLAHHGGFSSVEDDSAPETFTRVELAWSDGTVRADVSGQHLLTPAQVLKLVGPLQLHPVTAVLSELRTARI